MSSPAPKNPIQRAVDAVDGQAKLAKLLTDADPDSPIAPALVWQWVNGRRPVAPKHCIPIEQATGGAVTRYQLRPDVFGEPPTPSDQQAAA